MKKDRKGIEELQEKKLRKLLRHAYTQSPFYRKSFQEKGITEENIDSLPLDIFPTLNKSTFLENFGEIVTSEDLKQEDLRLFDEDPSNEGRTFRDRYHLVHSSGSTGTPRYFVYDEEAWDQMLLGIIRAALWDLSIPGMVRLLSKGIRILYIAAVKGRYGGAMAVGGGVDGLKGKRLFIDVNTPLHEWEGKIDEFNPNIIIGYPSALKILAELTEKGDVALDAARVISCGEPLSPGMRRFFEKVFCDRVVNVYGASESLALGVEIDSTDGMYLFDDLNIIEVEEDKIYLTSLYNFTQPLIRYEISDKLVLQDEPRSKAGPFTRAHVLLSRNEDILWFECGNRHRDFLHPLAIEGFCLEGLIDFQFRQTGKDSFEMLAQVPDVDKRPAVEAEMKAQMEGILREKGLNYVDFSLRFIDEIFPDIHTGKKSLILGNVRSV